jgi:ribonuclease D
MNHPLVRDSQSQSDDDDGDFDFNAQFEVAYPEMMTTKYLAIDTETTGLKVRDGTDYCIGISVAGRNSLLQGKMFSYYFPVRHSRSNLTPENQNLLFNYLLSRGKNNPVIYHNAKFDLFSLNTVGLNMDHVYFYDTVLMARMINENWNSLKLNDLSKMLLKNDGKRQSKEWEYYKALWGWSANFPADVMGDYATGDTELTLELFEYLWPYFIKDGFNG